MWIYQNEIFEDGDIGKHVGFVYLITNKIDDRKYVGKKLFWFTKTKTLKGKKKKEKYISDWKTYWSSSEEVKDDVKRLGEENFTREILYLCDNKGTMSYLELREQIDRRVLENNNYYNAFVCGKIHKKHVKL